MQCGSLNSLYLFLKPFFLKKILQVAYSMGVTEPLSVMVFSYGTARVSQARLTEIINKNFDLRPGKIVR